MNAPTITDEAAADAIETRAAQGLDPGVTDVTTLRSLSAILDPHLKAMTAPARAITARAARTAGMS